MDLHSALLLIGVALIVGIFLISRFGHVLKSSFENLARGRTKEKAASHKNLRNADSAPRFDDSSDYMDQDALDLDTPLFDYESDTARVDESQNVLLNDTDDEADSRAETLEPDQPDSGEKGEAKDDDQADDESNGPFTNLRQIDYWIKLSPENDQTQAQIYAQLSGLDSIEFPIQLHGLTRKTPHQWMNLTETQGDTEFMDIVASYQLINHGKAASLQDLALFTDRISALGEAMAAERIMMATPEQAQAQSEKLAAFYDNSGKDIAVSVCAPEGQSFMGKLVETSAKQQGLDYANGEYVRQKRMGSDNIVLYRMINRDPAGFTANMSSDAKIICVTFLMSPATSKTPGRDAKEMLDSVKAFASRVKGEIRIPGQAEYHQDQLLKLRNQVSKLEQEMVKAGLEPGGQEVRRIFS